MINPTEVFNPQEKGLDPEKPMFPISVVAEALQVHQRTLRIYDEEKILTAGRSPKRRRLYSFNDIERGKLIKYLTTDVGVNLAGIKLLFEALNAPVKTELSRNCIESLVIRAGVKADNREKLSKRGRKKVAV